VCEEKIRTTQEFRKNIAGVSRGISFVYYGLYLIVASILVGMLGGGLAGGMVASGSSAGVGLGIIVIFLVGAMIFLGTICGFAGRIMCLEVPDGFVGKRAIYGAVAFDLASLAITLTGWSTQLPPVADLLYSLMGIAATILFLVFLKRVAQHINDQKSEQRAGNVLKIGVGIFVVIILSAFLPPLLLIAGVLLLVGFVMYIRLLISLRESLRTA